MRREDRSSIVVSSSRRPRRVRGVVGYVIDLPRFALFLGLCRAVVPSSRPARADAPRAKGPSRPAVGLSCRRALPLPGCALTAPSTARGSGRSGRRLRRLDAFEGASLVENRPGDPGELVGERDRQHVAVQSFLGGFDPRFEAMALEISGAMPGTVISRPQALS